MSLFSHGVTPYCIGSRCSRKQFRNPCRVCTASSPMGILEPQNRRKCGCFIPAITLLGPSATEAAFKAARLTEYRVIHLAVHGFADSTFPDRAALVLLSDQSAGEDGFLQASEIARLRFDADLVVLSACDTAVGQLHGQEGTANLSRAFLMAGARTVVSTLWQVDDSSSLYLMKRFYAHLSANRSASSALTSAKRDMLRTFGTRATPYQWAGFTIEGALGRHISSNESGK